MRYLGCDAVHGTTDLTRHSNEGTKKENYESTEQEETDEGFKIKQQVRSSAVRSTAERIYYTLICGLFNDVLSDTGL